MITKELLEQANKGLEAIPVKGKNYVMVNKRVEAFRAICPDGAITTDIITNEGGVVVMKATVMDETGKVLSTGLSYEKEGNSSINKTSYIENCETSAVGRALGFLGIGIDTSIASAEEVNTAVKVQEGSKKISKQDAAIIVNVLEGEGISPAKVWELYKVNSAIELTELQLTNIKQNLRKLKDRYGK